MARVNKERALQLQERAAVVAKEAEYERAFDEVRVCLFVGGACVCVCVSSTLQLNVVRQKKG